MQRQYSVLYFHDCKLAVEIYEISKETEILIMK